MNRKNLTIKEAVRILKNGGVIAYPTETFYGLGAKASDRKAVAKIFKIKKRDKGKPISILIGKKHDVYNWADGIGVREKKLIQHFWPGPLTLVFKAKKWVPKELTAGGGKIGIRLSSCQTATKLCKKLGDAITTTSANLSGQSSLRSARKVLVELGNQIDGIVFNRVLKVLKGSTILDISDKKVKVLREGEIALKQIKKLLGKKHFNILRQAQDVP